MADLPTGTVTLLFTDIEGSTRLLEQLGPDYQNVLAEHHRLIRETLAAHDGIEIDTAGDAFFCVFARASDAVAAAADAQRALEQTPVRVRMGLHTGEPTRMEHGYVGVDLHRGARIMAAAHGGQVLLSQATRDLLGEDVALRDLGEHRLKDLASPNRLYQLGSEDFPPLKTLESRLTNLPLQPTPLVGREREVEEVASQLRRGDVRLVTLTGPGGTGKTRLALQAAAELLDDFADGVWFVNLAALTDARHVPAAIAQALSLRERPDEPIERTLASYLRELDLLLVLDNFEQVGDAAPFVAELEAAAPALSVLVTSRAALHLSGEREYAVSPLADEEAVALFAERARAVKTGFVLNGNRPLVLEICRRLDNLPLAVELAAARIKLLPEPALLDRLDERLKLLTGGARDLDERQRTLRATIDWSYNLLSPEEQLLFARLSVFAGGRTLGAIEDVCNPEDELDVFEGVASLHDKSLLRQEDESVGEARFVMLETIHEYARARLADLEEAEELRRRHADYFARLVEAAEPHLRGGPDQGEWLARLDAERDNVRAALAAFRGEIEVLGRFVVPLQLFWAIRGPFAEAQAWFEHVLDLDPEPSTRARTLLAASRFAGLRGDWQTTENLARQAVALFRDLGDRRWLGIALNEVGLAVKEQGQLDDAAPLYEEALQVARDERDRLGEGNCLNNLGVIAQEQGRYELATAMFERSLEVDRELGDSFGTAITMCNLGLVALGARKHDSAVAYARAALELAHGLGAKHGVGFTFDLLAKIAADRGEVHLAASLFSTSHALLEESGFALSAADKDETAAAVTRLRGELGEKEFERVWAEAIALPTEDAVAAALEDTARLTARPA